MRPMDVAFAAQHMLVKNGELFRESEWNPTSARFVASARAYYGATFRFCLYAEPIDALVESLAAFVNS